MSRSNSFYSYLEGIVSIVLNIILFVLKYWAGIVSGSVALIADAWHTLSDSISSIVVIISTKVSSKPADEEHPFGHGRSELVAAIFIGFLLGFIAFEFGKEAIEKLSNREESEFGTLAIIVTVASILLKEILAQVAFWTARKTNNIALKADGWHHRTDALSSVILLIGILLGSKFWWIDGVLGIIISLFILFTAYEILKDTIRSVLGEKPNEKLVQELEIIANKNAKCDVKVHHVHVHNYVRHKEVTFHINLPSEMSVHIAHIIATKIENEIRSKLKLESTIHIEPFS